MAFIIIITMSQRSESLVTSSSSSSLSIRLV